jgi:hypothetical protein
MPVRKFRTIEEMNAYDEERRATNDFATLARRIEAVSELSRGLLPPLDLPKGVHKFRSFEELCAFKERYRSLRIERLRAEREKQ